MKQLLWFLAVLGLTASVSSAGPNQGGVLWVHDTGIFKSSDPTTVWPPAPTDCAGVDNEIPLIDGSPPSPIPFSIMRIWKVYAAFPAGSSPRLKTTGWATRFDENTSSPYSYVNVAGGEVPDADGPGTDFFIGDLGFPTADGGQIGQSFPTGPRLGLVTELFRFWGFGYNGDPGTLPNPTWETAPHSAPLNRVFGDDAQPTNEDPIAGYSGLGFGVPDTTRCPTNDPDAACCARAGTCTIKKEAACLPPAVWHREWFTCSPNPCPLPTGACCYTDGRCLVTLEVPCGQGGGTYQGHFVPCATNTCPRPGACCFPSGACQIKTQTACAALDSVNVWHSEWTTCLPNQCPQPPVRACCDAADSCFVLTEAACLSVPSRIWHSDWETCPEFPCPQPVFACCNVVDGTCVDTTLAACVAPIRIWHRDVLCDSMQCPPAAPTGVCCRIDGSCMIQAELLCPLTGADRGTWYPDSSSCDPNPCPQPPGTCCDPLRGGCLVAPEVSCLPPSVWQSEPKSCAPNPCWQPPKGVCCSHPMNCSVTYEADCQADRDIWHEDWSSCPPNDNPCPEPLPTGGCCTINGLCSITLSPPDECTGEDEFFNPGWTYCSPTRCPQPPSGACCDWAGHCAPMAEYLCVADSLSVWFGQHADCDPNPCPPSIPPGVCCWPDGGCTITVEARCTDGVWTVGGTCTNDPCPLPGACCSPNGSCLVRSATQCVGADEIYQGNETVCTPNPCEQPPGACCFQNGTCELRTYQLCLQIGGTPVEACTLELCVPPEGACCFDDGTCRVLDSPVECDGDWAVYGTCDPNPCALSRGSCCDLSGLCTVTYARNCTGRGKVWTASAQPCASPCAQPGVCCVPAGTCTVTLETNCTFTDATWTVGGSCTPNPCLQLPSGSCCDWGYGSCEVTLQTACPDSIGLWTQSGTCVPNLCPPPASGACCTSAGDCTVTPEAGCRATWTVGGVCDPSPCPLPAGACCPSSGAGPCTLTPSVDCDGLWTALATCSPVNPCGTTRGACCDPSGSCRVTYEDGCADSSWIADSVCGDDGTSPCPPRLGGCCTPAGLCTVVTEVACGAQGVWHSEFILCLPNPCTQPAVCCDAGETCTLTLEADCDPPSIWFGNLPKCEPTSCPPMTPTERISWGRVKNLYR